MTVLVPRPGQQSFGEWCMPSSTTIMDHDLPATMATLSRQFSEQSLQHSLNPTSDPHTSSLFRHQTFPSYKELRPTSFPSPPLSTHDSLNTPPLSPLDASNGLDSTAAPFATSLLTPPSSNNDSPVTRTAPGVDTPTAPFSLDHDDNEHAVSDDDEAQWAVPPPSPPADCEDPSHLSRDTTLKSPPSRSARDFHAFHLRRARQNAVRRQCVSSAHLAEIAALVSRMVDRGEACAIHPFAGPCGSRSDRTAEEREEQGLYEEVDMLAETEGMDVGSDNDDRHLRRRSTTGDSRVRKHRTSTGQRRRS